MHIMFREHDTSSFLPGAPKSRHANLFQYRGIVLNVAIHVHAFLHVKKNQGKFNFFYSASVRTIDTSQSRRYCRRLHYCGFIEWYCPKYSGKTKKLVVLLASRFPLSGGSLDVVSRGCRNLTGKKPRVQLRGDSKEQYNPP